VRCGGDTAQVPLVVLTSGLCRYLAQIMRHNPHYARRLQELFPHDMFGTIARFLFRPNKDLTKMTMVRPGA